MTADRRRPTLDDIARAAGVSRATASNAYNRPDQLSARVREEVLRTAKSMGYAGPHPVARNLARQRSGAIAFLLDAHLSQAFSDPALSITLDALATALAPDGHALVLIPGANHADRDDAVEGADGGSQAEQVRTVQADLAVVYSLADDASALRVIRERRLPLVAVDGPSQPGATLVTSDDREGAAAAARHLTELGHRRIGILASRGVGGSPGAQVDHGRAEHSRYRVDRERLAGYLDTLARAGVRASDVPIREASGSSRMDAFPDALDLLTIEPRPTALLCMSDELAVGAMQAAHSLGLEVPHALSLVGFDDTPAARFADPALTTVRQDLVAKGRLAGEIALRLLAGRHVTHTNTLGVELVVRATTAAPADG